MSKIKQSIEKLLDKHRILIWYDAEQAFTEEYESLELTNAQKLQVEDNELEVKVKVLLEEPDQRFLLYLPKKKPENSKNWLLDIELANHVYHTDQKALYLQEVGLGYHYKQWIGNHMEFFKNKKRVAAFKNIAREEDGDHALSLKLLQILFQAQALSLNEFLRKYASAFINGRHEAIERELVRFGVEELFWQEVAKKFGYTHEEPSIYDFLLEVFQKNFTPMASSAVVNNESGVMMSTWKDTLSFQADFQAISEKIQSDLPVEDRLNEASLDEIIDDDVFKLIDKRVISELTRGILDGSVDRQRLERDIKKRESTYWFDDYKAFYRALMIGFNLLEFIDDNEPLDIPDFDEGVKQYTSEWYKVDQYYRNFIEQYRVTNQNNVLNPLYNAINKAYSNNWLLNFSNSWQQTLDKTDGWPVSKNAQTNFFKHEVKPFIKQNTRLFVIISDALRYECGVSLHELMQKEKRFDSSLDHQVTMLPSYTQLGMASLLPHGKLSFGESDDVLIDGASTQGARQREKVLQKNAEVQSTVIDAEDMMKIASRSDEAKDLVSNHDLIYVYHNRIDKLGDDKNTEEKVIEAAKDEIKYLVRLVKKAANIGGYNILITADHGFIYQNDGLDESDFADAEVDGNIIKKNRRFVLGKNLTYNDSVVKYDSSDVGIEGNVEILIPKGINRLRVRGAGSRYVHGGATLQETIVPLIHVIKKRKDTIERVDVDVLNKRNNKISTNIQRIRFYQNKPVSENVLGRSLKVQFKSENDEILSDVMTYNFDSKSKTAADREYEYKFRLSGKAKNNYKNKTIYLTLEEQVKNSNKWIEYDSFPYTVNISFTNDFDEF